MVDETPGTAPKPVLPDRAAQSPAEVAGRAPDQRRATPDTQPAGRRLATTGYVGRFLHPDHPDVVLTPHGAVDTDGTPVELSAEQVDAFRVAADACGATLRDLDA